MKAHKMLLILLLTIVVSACSQEATQEAAQESRQETEQKPAPTEPKKESVQIDHSKKEDNNEKIVISDELVFIEGGNFASKNTNFYEKNIKIPSFYIGRYEVTQKEWEEVMGDNPSAFVGEYRPVEMISWYDAIVFCNLKSEKEGLEPYYIIDKDTVDPDNKSEYDPIKWKVTINEGANGYRLPTEAEWEYAASGGQLSKGHIYSGSNDINEVSWNWRNAGKKYIDGDWNWPIIENNRNETKIVGSKKSNELELYDMSGNVREWVWDWYVDEDGNTGFQRVVKGGGWMGVELTNEIKFRGKFEASGYGPDQGFRLARNAS